MEIQVKNSMPRFITVRARIFHYRLIRNADGGDLCFINIGGEPDGSHRTKPKSPHQKRGNSEIHNIADAFHINREWPSPLPGGIVHINLKRL